MAVTLRVSSYQSRGLGSEAVRVFQSGGSIGRAPTNDWVLPDPDRFVSGQHVVISLEDGGYVLTDRSTNGTGVNGRELPKGGSVRLNSGDQLTIGNYEISVAVDAVSAAPPSLADAIQPTSGFALDGGPMLGVQSSVDPLDFFADPDPAARHRRGPPGAESDHAPADAEFFAPPEVGPDRAAAAKPDRAAPSAAGSLIPENWDETGFSPPDDPPVSSPASSLSPPPPVAVEPPESEPPTAARAESATVCGIAAAEFSGRGAAADSAGGTAVRAEGVAVLLSSAGIDPAEVDEATMASLGEVLHVVVEGLMDVLRARTAIKNQFRVPMTTLKPVENNPLKFSADASDALFNLLARRNRSYKAPVDAFREAFDDMRAHQIAMMAGMRAAFAAVMRRFDPEVLQESFDRGLKRGALLEVMNKTKYWDLYREMYEELGDDDATFRRLFGDEFAQAYEEQMQRLTTLQKHR